MNENLQTTNTPESMGVIEACCSNFKMAMDRFYQEEWCYYYIAKNQHKRLKEKQAEMSSYGSTGATVFIRAMAADLEEAAHLMSKRDTKGKAKKSN